MTKVSDAAQPILANPEGVAAWNQSIGQGLRTMARYPVVVPSSGTFTPVSDVFSQKTHIVFRHINRLCDLSFYVKGTLSGITGSVTIELPVPVAFQMIVPIICLNPVVRVASEMEVSGSTATIIPNAGSFAAGEVTFCGSVTYFTT